MSDFIKITEQASGYRHLEKMPVGELLVNINNEDKTVALAVEKAIPQIEKLVSVIADKMLAGGRLFYIGAGTSGRLAVVDASECPPTYGVPYGLVVAIIAGGDEAITKAVENAEDDRLQGWKDLQAHHVNDKDVVIGIAASGTTPYVTGGKPQKRHHHRQHHQQPGLAAGACCRLPGGSGGRAGVCYGKHKNEKRYLAKAGAEHDFHVGNDPVGKGRGQQNGEHATHQ
jgi:phosphoheptose isomerase